MCALPPKFFLKFQSEKKLSVKIKKHSRPDISATNTAFYISKYVHASENQAKNRTAFRDFGGLQWAYIFKSNQTLFAHGP